MAKSRLGKGLGALFPTIPEEKSPNTLLDLKVEAEATEAAAANTKGNASASQQATTARQKPQPSRGGRKTGGSGNGNGSSSSSDGAGAQSHATESTTAAATTKAATKTAKTAATAGKTGQPGQEVRSSIPDWSAIAHPSDMFFSNTRNDAAEKGSATPAASGDLRKTATPGGGRVAGEEASGAAASVSDDAAASVQSEELRQVKGAYLAEIAIDDVQPNEYQPRSVFDEEELQELSDSIKEVGVLQPIVVRVRKTDAAGNTAARNDAKASTYELIMGERRLRASKMAGKTTIPAIVKTTDDSVMLRDALLENLHRVQLNPLEEAAAYQQMITEFGLTQAQLSKSVSKSRPQITNTLRLLQLPGSVQKRVASGVLSAGHARALLGLSTEKQMLDLAKRIVAEGLSVRSTEEIVVLEQGKPEGKTKRPRKQGTYWSSSPLPKKLEDHFETKVQIRGTEEKGRIEITFASPDDLKRITDLLVGEGASSEQSGADGWV